MNDVSTQVMPDNNVYMLGWQTLEKPTAQNYVTAFDPADKNTISPNDKVFKATTAPDAPTVNAFAKTSQPIENENLLVVDAPSKSLKPILLIAVLGAAAFYFYKKGKK